MTRGAWVLAMGAIATAAVAVAAEPTWTPLASGVNVTFRGVSAVSDAIAWASGSGSTVLRTDDGGATWQKISITTDRVDFRDVDAIDARMKDKDIVRLLERDQRMGWPSWVIVAGMVCIGVSALWRLVRMFV